MDLKSVEERKIRVANGMQIEGLDAREASKRYDEPIDFCNSVAVEYDMSEKVCKVEAGDRERFGAKERTQAAFSYAIAYMKKAGPDKQAWKESKFACTWRVNDYLALNKDELKKKAKIFEDMSTKSADYKDLADALHLPEAVALTWKMQLDTMHAIDIDADHEHTRVPAFHTSRGGNRIYAPWVKREAIRLFDQGLSVKEVRKAVGKLVAKDPHQSNKTRLNAIPVEEWWNEYEKTGDKSVIYGIHGGDRADRAVKLDGEWVPRTFKQDVKKMEIVQELKAGRTAEEVHREFDVDISLVELYEDIYDQGGFTELLSGYAQLPDDIDTHFDTEDSTAR